MEKSNVDYLQRFECGRKPIKVSASVMFCAGTFGLHLLDGFAWYEGTHLGSWFLASAQDSKERPKFMGCPVDVIAIEVAINDDGDMISDVSDDANEVVGLLCELQAVKRSRKLETIQIQGRPAVVYVVPSALEEEG